MPRGHKSKHRAREKRRQVQEETRDPVGTQATVSEEEESSSSPSPGFKDDPQSSPATGTPSKPQGRGGVRSTTASAGGTTAVSSTRFNGGANHQAEDVLTALHASDIADNCYKGPLEERVVVLVHYLLCKYQRKETITKVDMLRNVIQMYKHNFQEILKRASEYLELVFGLDVKEMDPYRNTYILINKLELSYDSVEHRGVPKTGVLMTILGVIFMRGNCATEEEVWRELSMMGLNDGRKHFIFGDPKKLVMEDFVKQGYLEYRQVPNSEPPSYVFLWGPRAHAETSKMKVLEFVAKINNTVPSAFPSRYEDAVKDEEERAQARSTARARIAAIVSARSKAMSKASGFSFPK